MCAQVLQATQTSIETVSDSEFLQWVWLESNLLGPHPPDKQVSMFMD